MENENKNLPENSGETNENTEATECIGSETHQENTNDSVSSEKEVSASKTVEAENGKETVSENLTEPEPHSENGGANEKPPPVKVSEQTPPVQKNETLPTRNKIDVLLKAAGDAPIMKKKKWAVDDDKPVAYLTQFIKKYIKCEPHESLFLYVNQTFVPSQDQELSNLFECFGADGKLILHYCKAQAWG